MYYYKTLIHGSVFTNYRHYFEFIIYKIQNSKHTHTRAQAGRQSSRQVDTLFWSV